MRERSFYGDTKARTTSWQDKHEKSADEAVTAAQAKLVDVRKVSLIQVDELLVAHLSGGVELVSIRVKGLAPKMLRDINFENVGAE